MGDPDKAPITGHELICKADPISPSTHNDTDDICASEARTDEVHACTVSGTSSSNATQSPNTKQFCTFAVNTGLTHSRGLPPELRLKVYKAAFPEMDRSTVDEKAGSITDPKLVFVGPWHNSPEANECQDKCRDLYKEKNSEKFPRYGDCELDVQMCTYCMRKKMCDVGCDNRLREVFASNFARDPKTRVEFLTEYLRQVRFYQRRVSYNSACSCSDCDIRKLDSRRNLHLWRFLSMLAASGLVDELKHLTIDSAYHELHCNVEFWNVPIGDIFAILFRFRVKLQVSFDRMPPTCKPILDRIMEIVKMNLSCDSIDEFYRHDGGRRIYSEYCDGVSRIFEDDRVLEELTEHFQNVQEFDLRKGYLLSDSPFRYPVDFSQ